MHLKCINIWIYKSTVQSIKNLPWKWLWGRLGLEVDHVIQYIGRSEFEDSLSTQLWEIKDGVLKRGIQSAPIYVIRVHTYIWTFFFMAVCSLFSWPNLCQAFLGLALSQGRPRVYCQRETWKIWYQKLKTIF